MKFLFCCLAGMALSVTVRAQVTVPDSPIKQAADHLVAITKDDYYAKLLFSELEAAVDPCAETLCTQKGLPVTLISFTGERRDDENVALFWETSEEVSNDYFVVERTLNPSFGYEAVATVRGAGSSAVNHKYETKDANDYAGYTYYRLKQVDLDGTYAYSSVIAVKGGAGLLKVTAFPNPGQGKNMAFKVTGLKRAEKLVVVIYDVHGRVVYQNNNFAMTPEEQIFRTNLSNMSLGKYDIKIKSKDREATSSFVIVP